MVTRHLDLGCGPVPRNPLARDQVYGVDIAADLNDHTIATIVSANVAVQPIPFEDSYFDSVSAFDFFEHVPRVFLTAGGIGTRFPFVELMNEVFRVLRPNAVLYAVTPAYPSQAAFQDPTHVNIITAGTHLYFAGDKPLARMYGFTGNFAVRRAHWAVHKDALQYVVTPSLLRTVRHWNYRRKNALTHFVWDLTCIK